LGNPITLRLIQTLSQNLTSSGVRQFSLIISITTQGFNPKSHVFVIQNAARVIILSKVIYKYPHQSDQEYRQCWDFVPFVNENENAM
jgi:hypothetical protein